MYLIFHVYFFSLLHSLNARTGQHKKTILKKYILNIICICSTCSLFSLLLLFAHKTQKEPNIEGEIEQIKLYKDINLACKQVLLLCSFRFSALHNMNMY